MVLGMSSPEVTEKSGLLTPREVMRRLNVSQKTLWRWAETGQLAAVRLPGGHRRYRPEDIEAIERGEASA